jgi:hypothetical protein
MSWWDIIDHSSQVSGRIIQVSDEFGFITNLAEARNDPIIARKHVVGCKQKDVLH